MAEQHQTDTVKKTPPSTAARRWPLLLFGIWFAFQVLFPLRHLLYPGSPSWTEEGHRFAWQMKLRDKKADVVYSLIDTSNGETWEVWPEEFLESHQLGMQTRPDMLVRFGHYLAEIWREDYDIENMEVRVRACVSLNGRQAALLVDPERDLLQIEPGLGHSDWILPLQQPFERPARRKGRRNLDC